MTLVTGFQETGEHVYLLILSDLDKCDFSLDFDKIGNDAVHCDFGMMKNCKRFNCLMTARTPTLGDICISLTGCADGEARQVQADMRRERERQDTQTRLTDSVRNVCVSVCVV